MTLESYQCSECELGGTVETWGVGGEYKVTAVSSGMQGLVSELI